MQSSPLNPFPADSSVWLAAAILAVLGVQTTYGQPSSPTGLKTDSYRDGRLLAVWQQFGRPSGIYIDQHDVLYASDSESRNAAGYGHHPGWQRGIRVGRATDGEVMAFIRDPAPDQEAEDTTGGEGVAVDAKGNIYSAQVKEQDVVKYVQR